MLTIALASVVAAMGSPPVSAPTLRLDAAQVLSLADQAGKNGDIATAEEAYRALSEDANPDVRAEALFRHALMLSGAGQSTRAALLLRRLLDERPDATRARLELAQILDRLGEKDAAWREVRAVQASGLPPDVARLVDRYSEALRAARPFGVAFQIAIAPDSNINRSTRSDALGTVLGDFEIDESDKARSGIGLSVSGQAYRRLPLGKGKHNLLVRASAVADLYRHTNFNDIALDIAAGPELQLGNKRLTLEAGATQRWYGMGPYMRSARLSTSLVMPVDRRTQVQLIASLGLLDYRTNDLQDGRSFVLRAKVERALSATTGVGLNLSGYRTAARDPAYSTTEWRVGLLGWRDIGRATFRVEGEIGRLRTDDRLVILPDRRADKYSRFTLGATFRQFTFGGFAPVTRIVIERNKSTVEFYDYRRTRTEFGVVRAF